MNKPYCKIYPPRCATAVANRSEAEPLIRRALAIDEKGSGPEHPDVATDLNNLALPLQTMNRLSEAEPLYRRALAIDEKSFGPSHPDVAIRLNNLALLLEGANRISEAEPLMRRALAIDEKSFGPDLPKMARDLNNPAALLEDQGRWPEAIAFHRKAKPVITGAHAGGDPDRGGLRKTMLAQNAPGLRAYARAVYHAGASNFCKSCRGFRVGAMGAAKRCGGCAFRDLDLNGRCDQFRHHDFRRIRPPPPASGLNGFPSPTIGEVNATPLSFADVRIGSLRFPYTI